MNKEKEQQYDELFEAMLKDNTFSQEDFAEYNINAETPVKYKRLIAMLWEKGFDNGFNCYQYI